jgi:RND family efflux transporter MFP subunit
MELDWLVKYVNRTPLNSVRFSAAAVLISFLLTGCESHLQVDAASASAPVTAAPVATRAPAPSASSTGTTDAKLFTTSGPLVAEQQADVAAERDGRIVQIAIEIGGHVHKGRLLALLDDRTLRSAVDSQKARVASLHAQVAEWEAEQKSGEADLRRADIMRSEKIRSEEDWEHVKYKLDETIAEVARYRAEETGAQADLEIAKLQLDQSRIVAPFEGVVGRSSVRPTQEVKKGDVLFWITAVAPLHILFTVPESSMGAFTVGAPLELTTADYPGLRQPARILRVSPVVDPASGSVQVIGLVNHASRLLKPGMSMQVRLAP